MVIGWRTAPAERDEEGPEGYRFRRMNRRDVDKKEKNIDDETIILRFLGKRGKMAELKDEDVAISTVEDQFPYG